MTFNQIVNRLKLICSTHKQIRTFKRTGKVSEFLIDKQTKFVAAFLVESTGTVSPGTHQAVFAFRLYVLDLTYVSEETDMNEQDVLSDTFSIILDLLTQIGAPQWQDWQLSLNNNAQSLVEYDDDITAGWYVDFTIATIYSQNICAVPSTLPIIPDEDMKETFDAIYIANGTEGYIIYPPEIVGMKVLLVIRENNTLYKVSTVDNTIPIKNSEFAITIDNGIRFGNQIDPGERTLILYRKY